MALLDMAIMKDPYATDAYFGKAAIFSRVHNDEEAVKNLKKTIELNPNFARAYQMLGEYALTQKEYAKTIDYLLKSASLVGMDDDKTDFYEQYGYYLLELDIEQSCQNFKKSYERNPKNYNVISQLVNCSRYYQDYEEALDYALEYFKHRPDYINAKNVLALSYLTVKQFDNAEKYYREMMSTADQFKNDYMIYPFAHRLGYAMLMNGKKEEGVSIMEAYRDTLIVHINRQEIKAFSIGEYYDLATIYSVLNQKQEALKWLNTAREKETEGAFFRIDFLIFDPMLDNLREEPEFKKMLDDKFKEREKIKQLFMKSWRSITPIAS